MRKKGRMRSFLGLALMAGMLAGSLSLLTGRYGTVFADTPKSYQSQIDEAKENREKMEREQEELHQKIRELKAKKADMEQYIRNLDEKTVELLDSIDALDGEILACEERLENTRLSLAEIKQKEINQYETMKRRVQYMYENGEVSFLDVLLGDGNLSELFNRLEYQREITAYDNELLQRYHETKTEIVNTELVLEAQLLEMDALRVTKEAELAAITELSDAKAQELLAMAENIGVDEEMLFNYWDELAVKDMEIEELERLEAERIAEEERKRKEEEERLRLLEEMKKNQSIDNMVWPVPDSSRVTSKFGPRKAPTAGASTYHRGIDIGAARGTDVLAAIAGTVTTAGYDSTSGYHIVIDHGNGVETKYLHASKLLVKAGQYVERGQVIMKVGSTGVSTGPHLHFGLYTNGIAVDPLKYVSFEDKLEQ